MAGRVSQEVLEVLELPNPDARISQITAKVLASATPEGRAGQVVARISAKGTPDGRAGQVIARVGAFGSPKIRSSQLVIEVLLRSLIVTMPPIYPDLPGLTWPVTRRIKGAVQSQKTATGGRIDIALADSPTYEWDLVYSVIRGAWGPGSEEYQRIFGFVLGLNVSAGRFLYQDKHDMKVTGQAMGTTDGTTAVYSPIVRTFGTGVNSGTEPVGYVDTTKTVNVYLDGVWQDPLNPAQAWSILQTIPVKQQLKFNNTPAAGKVITMDFEYFFYCAFVEDKFEFEEFVWGLHEVKKISLMSLRSGN